MGEPMSQEIRGRVFVAGDDVNTDEIIPARYCATTDVESLGQYALEDLHPSKSPGGVPFRPGEYDIIVAGENFGCGSSREVANKLQLLDRLHLTAFTPGMTVSEYFASYQDIAQRLANVQVNVANKLAIGYILAGLEKHTDPDYRLLRSALIVKGDISLAE